MSVEEKLKSELERLIKAFLDEILARLEPCCVILFGSYARGSYTEYSDIDLCVISDRLPTDIVKRRTIATGIPRISAIGFTKDEVSRMIDDLNPLILDIVYHGKPLIGGEVYMELRRKLDSLIDRGVIERRKNGWIFRRGRH